MNSHTRLLRRIRIALAIVIVGLVVSGVTAFPLETEVRALTEALGVAEDNSGEGTTGLTRWLVEVRDALIETNDKYPFMAYGTDWLAFGHLVIALFFVGAYRDPVRNRWVVVSGLIACGGVVVLAAIAGEVRQIPVAWRVIDCSFGVLCALPLLWILKWTRELEQLSE